MAAPCAGCSNVNPPPPPPRFAAARGRREIQIAHDVGRDDAGVQRVRRRARALQALRELEREQAVGELRVAVGLPFPALPRKVVELDAAGRRLRVRHTADDDDAALRRRGHAVEQAVDENEVPQVIDDELRLEAAHLLQLGQQHAGIANERIDRRRRARESRRRTRRRSRSR